METCNTCGKPANHPFRIWDNSGIIRGCVDSFHTEALRGVIQPSTSWHFRSEAKQIRAFVKNGTHVGSY